MNAALPIVMRRTEPLCAMSRQTRGRVALEAPLFEHRSPLDDLRRSSAATLTDAARSFLQRWYVSLSPGLARVTIAESSMMPDLESRPVLRVPRLRYKLFPTSTSAVSHNKEYTQRGL